MRQRKGKKLRDWIVKKHWRDVWRFQSDGSLRVEDDDGNLIATYRGLD